MRVLFEYLCFLVLPSGVKACSLWLLFYLFRPIVNLEQHCPNPEAISWSLLESEIVPQIHYSYRKELKGTIAVIYVHMFKTQKNNRNTMIKHKA